ncbi:site-specific integrase [Trichocoleus sp. FACHB-591]|uniref:site-specific integrase n=1 Tax=Trichocoleus sp. FACHB-591 TaxID=2692872 RepID=UPI0016852433|nr:site-specific integrase [Trichocoleus sp. FACHB-591]MBD2095834.1 site-specific integrase [Trichocoleus sp. FACHB-591]
MQTILGSLQYFEKELGEQGEQQFRELMSAIRKFLLPGWGFPSAPIRSTAKDIENAKYALANLPIEKMFDWRKAIEHGFDIAQKDSKQRSVPRSHINKFVQWCFKKSILVDPDTIQQVHKIAPKSKSVPRSLRTRRSPVDLSRYRLLEREFTIQLSKEIQEYQQYLQANFYQKRRAKAVREETVTNRLQVIRAILGWLHFHCDVPRDKLSLDLVIRRTELQGFEANAAAEEFRDYFVGFAQFLRERGNQYGTICGYLAGLTRLAQFQYLGKYSDRHGNDIPVMQVIRELIEYYDDLAEDELEPIPIENKWLDLPEIIQKVTLPLFACTESKTGFENLRTQNSIASSFQDATLWGFMSLMPPRRSGEWRTGKVAMSCSLDEKPPDLRDGEWIWPLPKERWNKNEIKYSYLTRQIVYQDPATLERFGAYLGTVPPTDRYLERVALWFKDTPSQAAKSGESHKYQRIVVLDRGVYQGKRFYDFIEAYLMGYWRDHYGNWLSVGQTMEQPSKNFKFYELRSSIAKDPQTIEQERDLCILKQQPGYLFVGRETGTAYRQGDFGAKFARAAYRFTEKFITPHLLRSIYAVHMLDSGCSRAMLASLATAMGHKIETLEYIYDKRRPQQKTRMIEVELQKRIDRVCAGLPAVDPAQRNQEVDFEALKATIRQLTSEQRRLLLS